jgi:hypothetical protein
MIEYFHDHELRKNAQVHSYETNLWNIATNKILSIVFYDILIGYAEIS